MKRNPLIDNLVRTTVRASHVGANPRCMVATKRHEDYGFFSSRVVDMSDPYIADSLVRRLMDGTGTDMIIKPRWYTR